MKKVLLFLIIITSVVLINPAFLNGQEGNEQRNRVIEAEQDMKRARESAKSDFDLFMSLSDRFVYGAINRGGHAIKSEEVIAAEIKFNQFLRENLLYPLIAKLEYGNDSDIYKAGLGIYQYGSDALGIPIDSAQILGMQIMERAANNNNVGAMYHLGRALINEGDKERAATYLKNAEKLGHPIASQLLGNDMVNRGTEDFDTVMERVINAEVDKEELLLFLPALTTPGSMQRISWLNMKKKNDYHPIYDYLIGLEYHRIFEYEKRTKSNEKKSIKDTRIENLNIQNNKEIAPGYIEKAVQGFNHILEKKQGSNKTGIKKHLGDINCLTWYPDSRRHIAFNYYLAAAKEGNSEAQFQVGQFLKEGRFVTNNYAEALKWLRKSYENGNKKSISLLGEIYELGLGVKIDTTMALKYYIEAMHVYYPNTHQFDPLAYRGLSRLDQGYIEDLPPVVRYTAGIEPIESAIKNSKAKVKVIHIGNYNYLDTLSYGHFFQIANLIREYSKDQIELFLDYGIVQNDLLETLGIIGEIFRLDSTALYEYKISFNHEVKKDDLPITLICNNNKNEWMIFSKNENFQKIKTEIEESIKMK